MSPGPPSATASPSPSPSGDGRAESERRRTHNEQFGVREGACTAVMQGAGENYFTAFALTLHATTAQIGLLNALPAFLGTFAQLGSVIWLRWFDHRHSMVVAGAAAQALLWVPLLTLPLLFPAYGAPLLIACAVPFVVVGHFSIPAWNSLITDLIDPERRGQYFARRARVMSAVSFTALLAGGLLLTWTQQHHLTWLGFTLLFGTAAVARGCAAGYLRGLDESAAPVTQHQNLTVGDFLAKGRHKAFLRFLLFSGCMHVASLLAGPYFAVYLLRDLHFSYAEYSAWAAAAIMGGFLALNGWGRIGDRYGNRTLLLTTAWGLPVLPLLYLLSAEVWWILVINGLAGVVWSGFNLGLQNMVYDLVKSEKRAGAVAVSNGVIATAAFAGTMTGGWLGTVTPSEIVWWEIDWRFASNLPLVFVASAVLRLAAVLAFFRLLKEARTIEPVSHRELFQELPLIKPMMDVLGRRIGHQP